MAKPILLYTSIWEEQAQEITEQILESPENEPIEIWMNSPGGSVTAGWSIIAALQDKEFNVNVMGDASSMAFIMLLFAKKVTAYDTSNFLIHRAASWAEDYMNEDEIKDIENRNKIIRQKLEARIDESQFIKVTGKTFDDIFDMSNRLDVRLTSKQAKQIGLVDSIIKLDVKKRQEIESQYFNSIAAISIPETEKVITNKNSNIMGKLSDLIFGEKDSLLIGKIGESQFIYTKLEKGAKVKGIGKDAKPISGTFEAESKSITIVENEITAIVEVDKSQAKTEALEAKISELEKNQVTAEDIASVITKMFEARDEKIKALEADLAAAKGTKSSPKLPEGEFANDMQKQSGNKEYEIKKEIEARAAERQAQRDKEIKGGI